ncbi:uncharacterized protein AB9W97_009247 isoform 2-T3 [Spinachia spinachia]
MLLTPFCLLLPCLQVVPDRSQFFRYSSISLRCTDQWNSPGWTVKRKTSAGGVRPCTFGWGAASSGSSCVIRNTYPSDTGGYWCESSDGNRSNVVHITITDRAVLLESPALPVSVGAAVTLRCVAQATSPTRTFHFHKDGRLVASSSAGILTLPRASRSDRGLYACSVPRGGQSLGSWLEVQGERTSGSTDTSQLYIQHWFPTYLHRFPAASTRRLLVIVRPQAGGAPVGGSPLPAVHHLTGTRLQGGQPSSGGSTAPVFPVA